MTVFNIGANDYSNRVIAGSYSVNSIDVYKAWLDINGIEHREKIREKIEGEFDMYFPSIIEYENFMLDLNKVKKNDLSYRIKVCDNKKNNIKEIDAFLSFKLVRDVNGQWEPLYQRFKLTIQER